MIKILSLFSGIGSFEKAFKRLDIPFELVNYCEIDKYASKSYSLIHDIPESKNLWDVTKVDETKLSDFDLMTWGFPCTSISLLGKMDGFLDENGCKTQSGLYFDGMRILKEKKPKISIIENVKLLAKPRFEKEFKIILNDLENLGYNSYWKILNSKDYGIPQKRERVFIVSILKRYDDGFIFPEEMKLTRTFKDMLENEVDEKYYLKDKRLQWFKENLEYQLRKSNSSLSPELAITLTSRQNASWTGNHVEVLYRETNRHGFIRDGYNVYGVNGLCPTLKSSSSQRHENIRIDENKYRFLTPKECFRFMGFDDEDFDKVNGKISDSQLYKQTGNSIVVNVVEQIIKKLNLLGERIHGW